MAREDCTCFGGDRVRLGVDAVEYARCHLREVGRHNDTRSIDYVCPDYGKGWILDYPGPTAHGGPTNSMARLRTLGEACRDVRYALVDVEVILQGNEAAQRCAAELAGYLGDCTDAPETLSMVPQIAGMRPPDQPVLRSNVGPCPPRLGLPTKTAARRVGLGWSL